MAIPSYPTGLPHRPLRDGFTRTAYDSVEVTPMEGGPPRQRRRDYTGLVIMSYGLYLSEAQKGAFDTFVNETLNFGVKHFSMQVPATGSIYSTRRVFIQGGVPAIKDAPEGAYWKVHFPLLVYPQGASLA